MGILGLPFSLTIANWYGLIEICIIGLTMAGCGQLLGRCQRRLSVKSYPDIAEAAFGIYGHILTSLVVYFYLTFVLTIYFVLLRDSINFMIQDNTSIDKFYVTFLLTIVLVVLANILVVLIFFFFSRILSTKVHMEFVIKSAYKL